MFDWVHVVRFSDSCVWGTRGRSSRAVDALVKVDSVNVYNDEVAGASIKERQSLRLSSSSNRKSGSDSEYVTA